MSIRQLMPNRVSVAVTGIVSSTRARGVAPARLIQSSNRLTNQFKTNDYLFEWIPVRPLKDNIIPPPRRIGLSSVMFDKDNFLTRIGRGAVKYTDKFDSWDDLMTASSSDMKTRGIDVQTRKYIRAWVNKYSLGIDPKMMPITKRETLLTKK
eukprot:CFRG5901T1